MKPTVSSRVAHVAKLYFVLTFEKQSLQKMKVRLLDRFFLNNKKNS
jgi:hypothetical protein